MTLNIKAYSDKSNPEFKKHLKAVEFCVENGLSFPIETSEFFKGKVDGNDLESIIPEHVVEYIENGVEVPMIYSTQKVGKEARIKVADIPKEAVEIIIKIAD